MNDYIYEAFRNSSGEADFIGRVQAKERSMNWNVTPDKSLKSFYKILKDNSASPNSSSVTGAFSNSGNIFTAPLEIMYSTQKREYLQGIEHEEVKMQDVVGMLFDAEGKFKSLQQIAFDVFNRAKDNAKLYFEQQTALLSRVNKEIGLTGQFSEDFREELTNANPRLLQLGIGFEDLAQAAVELLETTGRFNTINQQTWERAGEIAGAYVGKLQDLVRMYPEFEKVGIGAADAQERIGLAGKQALDLGLRSKTVTKDLATNLSKLNEYGFKNGVEGLSQMVRKSVEFRMNMESVFSIADKVLSPEGAIELSANLQVLGGAIGDFNDPLKLMYMATNNVEGLQDALIGAAGSLATYNQEQGRFEITGVNLRRAKEMANQLGISYQELAKGAISAAERTAASADLMVRGLTLSPEQQEFLTNIAQMRDGRMTIEINSERLRRDLNIEGNTVALEELTQKQANTLLLYQQEFKKMSPEEIIRSQATSVMNIERDVSFLAALARNRGGRAAETIWQQTLKNAVGANTTEMADYVNKVVKDNSSNVTKVTETMQELFGVDKFATPNLTKGYRESRDELYGNRNQQTPQEEQPRFRVDVNTKNLEDTGKETVQTLQKIDENTFGTLSATREMTSVLSNKPKTDDKQKVEPQSQKLQETVIQKLPPPIVPTDTGVHQTARMAGMINDQNFDKINGKLENVTKSLQKPEFFEKEKQTIITKEPEFDFTKINEFTTDIILNEMSRMVDENINGFENLVKDNSKLIEAYHKEYGFISDKLNGFEEIPSYFDVTFKKPQLAEVETQYSDITKNAKENNFVTKEDLDNYMKPTEKVVEKETTKVSEGKITIKHDVNFTAQPVMDAFSREVLKNPDLIKNALNIDPRDYLWTNP